MVNPPQDRNEKGGRWTQKNLKELFFRPSVNAAEYREFPASFHRSAPLEGLKRLSLHAEGCPGRCERKEGGKPFPVHGVSDGLRRFFLRGLSRRIAVSSPVPNRKLRTPDKEVRSFSRKRMSPGQFLRRRRSRAESPRRPRDAVAGSGTEVNARVLMLPLPPWDRMSSRVLSAVTSNV